MRPMRVWTLNRPCRRTSPNLRPGGLGRGRDVRATRVDRVAAGTGRPRHEPQLLGHIDKSGLGRTLRKRDGELAQGRSAAHADQLPGLQDGTVDQAVDHNGRHGPDTTLFFIRVPGQVRASSAGAQNPLGGLRIGPAGPQLWLEQIRAHDQVWTPSDWCRDVLLAHGLDAKKLRVVEEGVDQRVFQPEPISHAGFVFLSVGKYEARKSIEETIEAFVADSRPRATLP